MWSKGEPNSAAYYIDTENKSTRVSLQKVRPMRALPEVGAIILFNELIKYQFKRDSAPHRGIGVVTGFSKHLMSVKITVNENFCFYSSFQITEIQYEIIRYVTLNKMIKAEEFSYKELDIDNLHPAIKAVVI